MATPNPFNRRAHDRFALPPMYTAVTADRLVEDKTVSLSGHAYDISETGVRIELDESLDPGETIRLNLRLPGGEDEMSATAEVMWTSDPADDPGPRRMALRFSAFDSTDDRHRLVRYLGAGEVRRAA